MFKKAVHYGDPDVSKRNLVTGTSTRQALEVEHIYVQTKPEANDFVSRREKTKVMLQDGIEVHQTPTTEYWLECIRNARYPQRSEQSQATTPVVKPIHDWTSHHRTSTEFFAVNYEDSYEQQVVVKIMKKEAVLLQKLRRYAFGKFVIHKANGILTRVEIN